jgi:putative tryptophan/tyrosine transport system substrate-binding protein
MRRRAFITLLGGAAAAAFPPRAARAQDGRVRRIGVLLSGAENDSEYQTRMGAFRAELAKLGWIEGQNLRLEVRFGAADQTRIRTYAAELMRLAPDVVITTSAAATRAVREQSPTVPIVAATFNDPIASGLVDNIARPTGNITGFAFFEPSMGSKWLELLKEAAPRIGKVALLFDPANGPDAYFASIEAAARTLAVNAIRTPIRNSIEIVRAIDAFAAEQNGGLLVFPDFTPNTYRETIFQAATRHRLPAIYPAKYFAAEGGLLSYGADLTDQYRRTAGYVDRLLRGAKVSELVQRS